MRSTTLALAAALSLSAPVFAQSPHAAMSGHMAPPASGSPAAGDMMGAMTKMNQAMSSAPMTGDVDHDFVVMMIPHHQGAVDMARYELEHGKDPELHKLAHDIIVAQDKEMAFMRRWVDKHPAK